MYERFSDRARRAMQLANQEAQRMNHHYIEPEHILLGLVKEGSGCQAHILQAFEADGVGEIRRMVEELNPAGPDLITMERLPQTPNAKKVVELAIEEAKSLSHNYVGTEHLLFALLRVEGTVAHCILSRKGMTLEKARDKYSELFQENVQETKLHTVLKEALEAARTSAFIAIPNTMEIVKVPGKYTVLLQNGTAIKLDGNLHYDEKDSRVWFVDQETKAKVFAWFWSEDVIGILMPPRDTQETHTWQVEVEMPQK